MSFQFLFSLRIYQARTRHGYTQAQTAEAVGISPRWYQYIEQGTRTPGALVMLRLILFLGLDLDEFREYLSLPMSSK